MAAANRRIFGIGRGNSAGAGGVREVRRAGTAAPEARRGAGQVAAAPSTTNRFSSRSRPALPAEILGGFSSSLLPPSFPRGRSATFFFAPRCPALGGRTGPAATRDEADRRHRLRHRRARGGAHPGRPAPRSRSTRRPNASAATRTRSTSPSAVAPTASTSASPSSTTARRPASQPCSPSSGSRRHRPRCRSRPRSPRPASNGAAPARPGCSRSPRNLLRPAFWNMLGEVPRFNRHAAALAPPPPRTSPTTTAVGDFLGQRIASRRAFATGTCCRCSAASGHARPSRCCACRWRRWRASGATTACCERGPGHAAAR